MNGPSSSSASPTRRLIGSEKFGEGGAVLTSELQSVETELLTQEENVASLAGIDRELASQAAAFHLRVADASLVDVCDVPRPP